MLCGQSDVTHLPTKRVWQAARLPTGRYIALCQRYTVPSPPYSSPAPPCDRVSCGGPPLELGCRSTRSRPPMLMPHTSERPEGCMSRRYEASLPAGRRQQTGVALTHARASCRDLPCCMRKNTRPLQVLHTVAASEPNKTNATALTGVELSHLLALHPVPAAQHHHPAAAESGGAARNRMPLHMQSSNRLPCRRSSTGCAARRRSTALSRRPQASCSLVFDAVPAAAAHVDVLAGRPGQAINGAAILDSPLLLFAHHAAVLSSGRASSTKARAAAAAAGSGGRWGACRATGDD